MSERFEEKLLAVLTEEVQSGASGPHLKRRELRRLLRGRTRVADLDRIGTHLAHCPECLSRYDREREALDSLWAATAAQRVVGGGTIFLRHAGAVLVAAAAVVLTFSLSPRPTAPELHPSSAASRAVAAAAAPTASAPDLTPQTLVRALRAFDGYPPQRAAAYTIGLLREYGVPLDSVALAFHAADVVVSGPDDTWQSVARSTMDDPALWPMVILLNMDKTQDGEFVPPGTYLRVPKTSAESGT